MTALWLFENLYFGVALPDAWINPPPDGDGFLWDISGDPDPDNGHCFVGVGYNPEGVAIDSWGLIGIETWPAVEKYCNEDNGGALYAVLSLDAINRATQKAANGFNFAQLKADLATLT
jgi:hypothetical protein